MQSSTVTAVVTNAVETNQQPSASSLKLLFWCGMSVVSSVGIILVNKSLMKVYGFNFVMTLTACHFLCQTISLEIASRFLGLFPAKRLPNRDNNITALVGVGSIVFMNYNLRFNSVGLYQMSKLLCIPLMVLIQTKFHNKVFSGKLKFTLFVILAGVGITTVTDIEVNLVGALFAVIAVLCTTQFQIWQGSKQAQHKLSSIQITHSVSLPMFVITFAAAVVTEFLPAENSVLDYEFVGVEEYVMIGLSCMLAIMVNISSFTLIGISSPVTYQVVGHCKTVLVLLGGIVMFSTVNSMSDLFKNLIGIVVAMAGVFLYGHVKDAEASGAKDVLDRMLPSCLKSCLEEPYKYSAVGTKV